MTPSVVTLAVRWYMTYCRGQRGLSQREGEWHTDLMHTQSLYGRMKDLLILLSTIALFCSCTSGTPEVHLASGAQQDLPPNSSSPQLILNLSAEVAPFSLATESAGGTDQLRGTTGRFNPLDASQRFISLFAQADQPDGKTLLAHIYIYRKDNPKQVIHHLLPLVVSSGGKNLSFRGDLTPKSLTSQQALIWEEMIRDELRDCYLSAVVGLDEEGRFTNKGVHSIPRWGDASPLPDNFVVLTSEAIPLVWHSEEGGKGAVVTPMGYAPIKFRMHGYLMALRFYNSYPKTIIRQRVSAENSLEPDLVSEGGKEKYFQAPRPPYEVCLLLSGELSATWDMRVDFSDGAITLRSDEEDQEGKHWKHTYSRAYEGRPEGGRPSSDGHHYDYLIAKQDKGTSRLALPVPVMSGGFAKYPEEDEAVALIYFPDPNDHGAITFEGAKWEGKPAPFYDKTPYTQYRVKTRRGGNKLYVLPLEAGEANGNTIEKLPRAGVHNRVYFQTFNIAPKLSSTTPIKGDSEDLRADYAEIYKGLLWTKLDLPR